MEYVRNLEQRVKQLEEARTILQACAQGWEVPPTEVWDSLASLSDNAYLGNRPQPVVCAFQVFDVRKDMDKEEGHEGEKALVKEMCNVSKRLSALSFSDKKIFEVRSRRFVHTHELSRKSRCNFFF